MSVDLNREQTPGPRCPIWLVAALSAGACGLALSGSLLRPVWHDELYTLWLARMPLADLFAALRLDSGPPLYYLICHSLFSIFGWPEGSALGTFMVRLPSIAAFSMMPWVLWEWARGRCAVFFWASALTMTWLPMLYFATEARAYALLAVVNAILWLLGPELVKKGGWRLALFSALAAALPMLHYAGLVSFCFLPALAFFIPRSRWRSLALALGAASLPILAWSPTILASPEQSMGWVDTAAGPGRPGLATVQVLAPAGPFPALFEAPDSPIPQWLSILILALFFGAAIVGLFRRSQPSVNGPGADETVRLGAGILPVCLLACVALAGVPVYFAGRTESMAWALVVALVVLLIRQLPAPTWRTAASAYVLFGAVTAALWLSSMPARPPAPGVEVGRALAEVIQTGDRVIVAGLWQLEVQHGLAEAGLKLENDQSVLTRVETLPRSQGDHPGWLDVEALSPVVLGEETKVLEGDARLGGGRIWIVWSPSLSLEQSFFPVFVGWQRQRVGTSALIAVDLITQHSGSGGEH